MKNVKSLEYRLACSQLSYALAREGSLGFRSDNLLKHLTEAAIIVQGVACGGDCQDLYEAKFSLDMCAKGFGEHTPMWLATLENRLDALLGA